MASWLSLEGKEANLASSLVESTPLSLSVGDQKESTSHKDSGMIFGAPGSFYLVSPVDSLNSINLKADSHGRKVESKPLGNTLPV